MAYKEKRYKLGRYLEIEDYYTAQYGAPGEKRIPKKKLTTEQMEKVNQYNREKIARRKLRTHFQENDYFITLTYQPDRRPADMAAAKEDFKKFMRQVRSAYRKAGAEVKWIRNIEVGTKNGWHIHLVLNRIQDADLIVRKAWPHGRVLFRLAYEQGGFADLAAYITKTPKTDPRLRESSYSTSRNLPVPEPDTKIYRRWKTWRKIRIPKGYYLDKESLREGINPITGYRYRSYTLVKTNRPERPPAAEKRRRE